jgi:hypothetical protein
MGCTPTAANVIPLAAKPRRSPATFSGLNECKDASDPHFEGINPDGSAVASPSSRPVENPNLSHIAIRAFTQSVYAPRSTLSM